MTDIEKQAIDALRRLWDVWITPDKNSILKSTETVSEQFKGFGTGIDEIWHSKTEFRDYLEQGYKLNPNGFVARIKWIQSDMISSDMVKLWGEMSITVRLDVKNVVIDPMRFTALYVIENGSMKLSQWHASEPDVSTEDEIWPGTGQPKYYEDVTILFTDFVGFTDIVSRHSPETLIAELNAIFAAFDTISTRHGIDKIKTIGDAYMAVGGLKDSNDHTLRTVRAAKEMLSFLEVRNKTSVVSWDMRVGIHNGPVIGGVIGSSQLSFDLWGDTVNMASRIESASVKNAINISNPVYERVKHFFPCTYRGKVRTKEDREVDMYLIE